VLCYLPVVFFEYGMADDYRLLAFYDRGFTNRTLMIAEGRPFQALWTNLAFASFHGIGSLAILRLLTILSWGVVAWLYASIWNRAGLAWREAALAAVAMLTLPAYQVFTASGGMGAVPFGVFFAGAAAIFTERTARSARVHETIRNGGAAVLLLVLALTTYQPVAMLYWVATAILVLVPDHPRNVLRTRVSYHAGIGFLALAIGYAVYKVGLAVYGADLAGTQRTTFAPDLVGKALWFVRTPLTDSLNLWNIFPLALLSLGVAVTILCGLLLHFQRSSSQVWLKLVVAAAFVPLTYLPNLLTAENWPAYRTQTALSSLLLSYLVIAIWSQLRARPNLLYRSILPLFALGGALTAAYNVTVYCAVPAERELQVARDWLRSLPAGHERLSVKRAGYSDAFADYIRYDEFGIPQTAQPWTAADLPYLIVRELRPELRSSQIEVRLVGDAMQATGTFVDWGEVLRASRYARRR
jgi:hypothetical protein